MNSSIHKILIKLHGEHHNVGGQEDETLSRVEDKVKGLLYSDINEEK
jgi:helix-turn-helix protein